LWSIATASCSNVLIDIFSEFARDGDYHAEWLYRRGSRHCLDCNLRRDWR
jgi:hypothetical protein